MHNGRKGIPDSTGHMDGLPHGEVIGDVVVYAL